MHIKIMYIHVHIYNIHIYIYPNPAVWRFRARFTDFSEDSATPLQNSMAPSSESLCRCERYKIEMRKITKSKCLESLRACCTMLHNVARMSNAHVVTLVLCALAKNKCRGKATQLELEMKLPRKNHLPVSPARCLPLKSLATSSAASNEKPNWKQCPREKYITILLHHFCNVCFCSLERWMSLDSRYVSSRAPQQQCWTRRQLAVHRARSRQEENAKWRCQTNMSEYMSHRIVGSQCGNTSRMRTA